MTDHLDPIMLIALLVGLGLGGCTFTQEQEACAIDLAAQPIVVPLEGLASALEPLASFPIMLGHQGAQAGCAIVRSR